MSFFWPHLLWLLAPVILLAAADSIRRGSGELNLTLARVFEMQE